MITKVFWQLLKWIQPGKRPRWDKDSEDAYDFNWMHTVANWWPQWITGKKPAIRIRPGKRFRWYRIWGKLKAKPLGQSPLRFRSIRDHVLVRRRENGPWVRL